VTLALAIVALGSLVAYVVSGPLGGGRAAAASAASAVDDRRAELEAAKEAKYREIRDARLDFRLGKLSQADHEATEAELSAQAMAIVRELEQVR